MKKIIATCLLLLGAGGVILYLSNKKGPTAQPIVQTVNYKQACDIFSLKDAVAVLGDGATQTTSLKTPANGQKTVTNCLYSYDPGSLSDLVTVNLLLQGAAPNQAKQSFENARPKNAKVIKGYGDGAYWDPALGQLDILKGKYWLIVSAGTGDFSQRTPDLARRVADIIVKRL